MLFFLEGEMAEEGALKEETDLTYACWVSHPAVAGFGTPTCNFSNKIGSGNCPTLI
jgi:hypothetical protein